MSDSHDYPPGSLGAEKRRSYTELTAAIAEAESAINAHWVLRWTYRLIKVLHWRPWRRS